MPSLRILVLNNVEMIVDEIEVVHVRNLLYRFIYIISLVAKEKCTLINGSLGNQKFKTI